MSATVVEATDPRWIVMTSPFLNGDWHFFGPSAFPPNGQASAVSGKLGKGYYYVSNTAASGAGSFLQARTDAIAGAGGVIVFLISGSWGGFTVPPNTAIDCNGQEVAFTGEILCNGARPIVMNAYCLSSADRGIDMTGTAPIVGFFPNMRGNGQIVDQMYNFTIANSVNNGQVATIPHNRFDFSGSTANFNAFGNFGSMGSGSSVFAEGGEDIFGLVYHLYTTNGVEIRTPVTTGGRLHTLCGYIHYMQEGCTVKTNVLGHVGQHWINHPSIHCTSGVASWQNQGFHTPDATAILNCPDVAFARKLGTTNNLVLQNAGSAEDPSVFYEYETHPELVGADHDTDMQNRAGNVMQVTIANGTLLEVSRANAVGTAIPFDLATSRALNGTWGTTQQDLFLDSISNDGFNARDYFVAADIVRTSATRVTATISKLPATIAEDTKVYFYGGPGIITASGSQLSVLMSWNYFTILGDGSVPPTGTYPVTQSSDDAKERSLAFDGVNSVTLTPLQVQIDHIGHWAGLRFPGMQGELTDPVGTALLRVWATDATNDNPNFTIFAEKLAAPVTFTTTAGDISSRTRTTASVAVNQAGVPTGAWLEIDVTTLVQELLDAAFDPSAIVLLLRQDSDTNGFWFESFDAGSGHPAELVIDPSTPPAQNVNLNALQVTITSPGVQLGLAQGLSPQVIQITTPGLGVSLGPVSVALSPVVVSFSSPGVGAQINQSVALNAARIQLQLRHMVVRATGQSQEVPPVFWVVDTPDLELFWKVEEPD